MTHLCQAGQVNKSKCQDTWTVNAKIDGLRADACVLPRLQLSVAHNLFSDFIEVVELLARKMQELSPLVGIGLARFRGWCQYYRKKRKGVSKICRLSATAALAHFLKIWLIHWRPLRQTVY